MLAYDLEVGSRYTRYAVAATLIVLVALSRVVLGVHFVRDVVVGITVGLGFLAVTIVRTEHDPRPGFLLAAGLGVAALVTSGLSQDSMAEFGAIVGAAVAWESIGAEVPSVETDRERLVLAAALPLFGGLGYLSLNTRLAMGLAFFLSAVLLAAIIVAPLIVTTVRS